MERPDQQAPVVFTIECIGVSECLVNFEPEGSQHVLQEDDAFRVEALPPAGANVEIAYCDGGIIVVWAERAFNKAGEELQL